MKKLRPLYVLQAAHANDTDLKNWTRGGHLPFSGTQGRLRLLSRADTLLVLVFAALGGSGMPLRVARYKAPEIVKRALGSEALQHAVFDPRAGVGRWFPENGDATLAKITAAVGPQMNGGGTAPAHQIISINVGAMLATIDWMLGVYGETEDGIPPALDEPSVSAAERDDDPPAGYASRAKIRRKARAASGVKK